MPGSADCDIYQIVDDGDGNVTLEYVESFFQTVYNVSSSAIDGDTWVVIKREKYGKWLVEPPGSGGGGFTRQEFDNADYAVTGTQDVFVAQIGFMSAARTVHLPLATARRGMCCIVVDESNTVNASQKIIVKASGSDFLGGFNDADFEERTGTGTGTSKSELWITVGRGSFILESDGIDTWNSVINGFTGSQQFLTRCTNGQLKGVTVTWWNGLTYDVTAETSV